MKIHEVMSTQVRVANPNETIQHAARDMAGNDAGILPVGENDRLVGMLSDRDMVVRGIAEGKGPDAMVRDVMSKKVRYCFDDQEVGQVAQNMAELQVRRLPVLNRDKRLVGIVSLGDIAHCDEAAAALKGISRPGGMHSHSG
jgi:CBS domain-containing protein